MNPWQIDQAIDAVVFDCDGTLSQVEGIDELAAMNGVGAEVSALTEQAMSQGSLNEALYEKRLQMTQPSSAQCEQLGELYYEQRMHGIAETFAVLKHCHKAIYVLSAGLMPSITRFMSHFGIEPEECLAVDIFFDIYGRYQDFDRSCPMVDNRGKYDVVKRLSKIHPRICHIGDGMNDYSAHELVSRFVGFGGAFYRESLKQKCEHYIEYPSLLALLPLVLTEKETADLPPEMMVHYEQGLSMLHSQLKEESS